MSRNVNDSRYAREITQSNSRRKFNSKRAALGSVRMVSFRCQQTRVNFPNSERWAKKFTISAECSEVSTLKNKRNHRCFLSNGITEFCESTFLQLDNPTGPKKGRTFGGRKQNTWSPIDGRCGNVGSTEQTNQSSPGGRNKRSKTNGKIAIEIDSKEEKTIPSGKTLIFHWHFGFS